MIFGRLPQALPDGGPLLRAGLAAALVLAACGLAAAEEPRLPHPRPEPPGQKAAPSQPQPRPAETPAIEETAPAPPEVPEAPPVEPADEAALARCEGRLRALGVDFKRRAPIVGKGGCGVAAPYDVSEIAPGVTLRPATEFTCETALATAEWVKNVVMPAAETLGDGVRLSGIAHASTYVCRNRNNQPNGKVSEHATGKAIDIATFELAGHAPLPVKSRTRDGDREEAFQMAVRAGACLYFTTVLGPGDPFHDTHLHLDIDARKGGFRLCQ
jgi:hypothetical protein